MSEVEGAGERGRVRSITDGVVGGLIANAITAGFVAAIASIGGWITAAQGVALVVLIALALGALLIPLAAFRDRRDGRLPSEINLGRVVVGGVLYAVIFGALVWGVADYVFG